MDGDDTTGRQRRQLTVTYPGGWQRHVPVTITADDLYRVGVDDGLLYAFWLRLLAGGAVEGDTPLAALAAETGQLLTHGLVAAACHTAIRDARENGGTVAVSTSGPDLEPDVND